MRSKNKIYLDTVKYFREVFIALMIFLLIEELKRFNTGFLRLNEIRTTKFFCLNFHSILVLREPVSQLKTI